MKIKTSELAGKALCYTICMIEMPHLKWGETIGVHEHSDQIAVPELPEPDCYSPFMSWALGGPIIEREKISTYPMPGGVGGKWRAEKYGRHLQAGPAPLIAAMRCYVASKLGEEVEVPDELFS